MFSVIIPTYNRKETLRKCLEALLAQTYPITECEIIVVDDGSQDDTRSIVEQIRESGGIDLKYFYQDNRGPSAARNVGVRSATKEYLLFLGDDIIAAKDLLQQHANWHRRNPKEKVAVLGYVTWSPELEVDSFMRWLINGGPQNMFYRIEDQVEIKEVGFMESANLSLKASLLQKVGGFDESLRLFENLELESRLRDVGMRLLYNKKAVGFHYHKATMEAAIVRWRQLKGERAKLYQKRPELIPPPEPRKGLKPLLRPLWRNKPVVAILKRLAKILGGNYRMATLLYPRIFSYYAVKGESR